ncbi:MYND finger domain-like protein [Mycena kentingensis (nom. inval.)]|nr:MYND finger domain-like protein [Mycena kentingensis (nom. inval.)]
MQRSCYKQQFCYKHVADQPVYLDVYPPAVVPSSGDARFPAVVYFHGGGLTVGSRTSWFPEWLQTRLANTGIVFVSVAYRLLPPATLHEILDDVRDAMGFLAKDDLQCADESGKRFGIDVDAIGTAGTSAGGTLAYLAAIHAVPRPRAVLGMYAMFGNAFSPLILAPKTEIFTRGRELLDPAAFSEFLYPASTSLPILTESALAYHPPDSATPGWPANPRMPLSRLYFQLGTFLDYITGQHEPSVSEALRPLLDEDDLLVRQEAVRAVLPREHHALFPQLNVTPGFPPTFLVHGSEDTGVPLDESRHFKRLLEEVGVKVELRVVDGAEHSFDYVSDAEERYGALFDEVAEFFKGALAGAKTRR